MDSIFVDPIRYRHFFRDDYDLDGSRDDGDNFDWFKIGFGSDLRLHELVRLKAAARIRRSWGNNVASQRQQDHLDLWEGYFELGSTEQIGIAVRGWRQVINLGNQRLVGALDWSNNARTFDGVRVMSKLDRTRLDAFWVRQVRAQDPDDRNFNRPDHTDFLGLYGSVPLSGALTLEPFYFVRYNDNEYVRGENGERGPLQLHSPGARLLYRLADLAALDLYAVAQYGKYGSDTIAAYAFSSRIDLFAPEGLGPLWRLRLEWNYGSGDQNPRDRRRGTFDNLYPTNHGFYGEMDLASWTNMISLEAELAFDLGTIELREPARERSLVDRIGSLGLPDTLPVRFGTALWSFWLAQRKDAWYSAGGAVLGSDPSGGSGRDVGREIDTWLQIGPVKFVYGHFWPGGFARRTRGNDQADLVYAEVLLRF